MATQNNFCAVSLAFLLVFALTASLVPVDASPDRTKTVEFNVKPGGVVHTFTEAIKEYECSFTYASQGGTNEQWLMSVGLSDDDRLFSCSVWRPQGKSYLFFTQFKAELKGTKIEYANAYSQTAGAGQSDVPLKPEEFIVGDSTVTHRDGKFSAQLSKLTAIGRTRHDEL
ncbi:myeloid-derived growth factor isoform X2 [Epinephelus moara]|uniref:myeloid-derived growth factor isoform X1 n=1 Tax=Epinephelus moara TaxID=300413 RepID=UPI00214F256D|nr:myeloid-derived growth factor isoform X1 [Epinephelus moara]XP_049910885.1 myeloid-derived growth factor isoform X2 [Epinephelus moara]